MEAKDGRMGFDFAGTYTRIVPNKLIECSFGGRELLETVSTRTRSSYGRERFDAEDEHSEEQQRQGSQAILNRFARYVEAKPVIQQVSGTILVQS